MSKHFPLEDLKAYRELVKETRESCLKLVRDPETFAKLLPHERAFISVTLSAMDEYLESLADVFGEKG